MNFDYYYGDESNQFAFYRIPRQLITGEAFKKLSTDAKLLYGLLLDRMGLSAKNGWYDDMGRVFIYYTLDEIQEDLNCGHEKAVRLLAELDTGKKGFGLIERVKQGQGRPTKIYVKRFTTRAIPPQPAAPQDIPRLPIFGSQDFGKAEVKSSEKQKSRLPVIGSADFRKSDTSYIESNQTDLSQLYPSIHPSATVPESRWIDRSECRREVQEAIEFPLLCQQFGYEDVESVTELIVDTLCSTRPTFRIGGAEMPAEQVKGRLQMLDNGHLEYVFDCMRRNTTEIRPPVHGGVPAYPKGRGKTLLRQRHPSPRLYGGGFPGRTGGGKGLLEQLLLLRRWAETDFDGVILDHPVPFGMAVLFFLFHNARPFPRTCPWNQRLF